MLSERWKCIACNAAYRPSGPAQKYCSTCGKQRKKENNRINSYNWRVREGLIEKPGVGSGGNQENENNPARKNGKSTIWQAKRFRKDCCELCGSTRNIDLHHKNKNRRDWNPSNLQTLCRSCHASAHQSQRNFLRSGKKAGRKQKQLASDFYTECGGRSSRSTRGTTTESK